MKALRVFMGSLCQNNMLLYFILVKKVTDYGQYYDVLNGLVTIVEMLLKDELKTFEPK